MLQCSLLMLWMDENMSQQSNKKLLTMGNLQLLGDSTTKQARTTSTWGCKQLCGIVHLWQDHIKIRLT